MYYLLRILLLSGLLAGCSDFFFPEEPKNTPVENFEVFWTDLDRYYPYFAYKGLKWDSVYHATKPLISPNTTNDQLFDRLDGIVRYLRDGHVDVWAGSKVSSFDFAERYPSNQLPSIAGYLVLRTKNSQVSYGTLGTDIGYLSLRSFSGSDADFGAVDDVLREFKERSLTRLIVDIRGNGGGSDRYSSRVASRFADQHRVYAYVRYKTGPAHHELGHWLPKSVSPDGERFDGKVMLLTNRRVFSAAEDFVLAMRILPAVTVVGDTTGGGSGNPLLRTLPNGWRFRVPRWQQVSDKLEFYEGKGLYPDLPVWISEEDRTKNRDTILETAMMELRK